MGQIHNNLWPDFNPTTIVTPVSILKEQAGYLGEKTKNIVTAEVVSGMGGPNYFRHEFYLVAPILKNYKYNLFYISHDVTLFPVTVHFDPENSSFPQQVNNIEELLEALKEIFTDQGTIRIIDGLIAQSR